MVETDSDFFHSALIEILSERFWLLGPELIVAIVATIV
jgi:hypothetical protein